MEMMLFEVQDVAKALGGIGPGSVRRYCADGLLPVAARTPRGVRLFRPADVEKFRKTREARPNGARGW